jgi:NAD(P)-dependent dehydrogenase (short-subunit alcohol dehydrogenase family)
VSEHGTPNILVNNAGASRWLPIAETSAEEAAQMMAVPYLAAFNITRELLGGMRKRASGHIVASIESGKRVIVKPPIFRLFFLLNTLFPLQTEALMCNRRKPN